MDGRKRGKNNKNKSGKNIPTNEDKPNNVNEQTDEKEEG
jgi:hypothetical protein